MVCVLENDFGFTSYGQVKKTSISLGRERIWIINLLSDFVRIFCETLVSFDSLV